VKDVNEKEAHTQKDRDGQGRRRERETKKIKSIWKREKERKFV